MEFDKVADEVVRIPVIDFTDVTLVINDTYGDTVRGGDGGDGHGGWQGSRNGGGYGGGHGRGHGG